MGTSGKTIWPKQLPVLTREQQEAREQFMQGWHEILQHRYQNVERFNHGWVSSLPHISGAKTLEIGAGLGAHMAYENLMDQDYFCLDVRRSFCEQLSKKMDPSHVVWADIQTHIPFPDHFFDRIIAIHILEHLPNLPHALGEIGRVLKKEAVFDVVIPCEGGLAYSLGRKLSAERYFKKRFNMDYAPIIKSEHVSTFIEINELLSERFKILKSTFFPLGKIPIYALNLCKAFRLMPKDPPPNQ